MTQDEREFLGRIMSRPEIYYDTRIRSEQFSSREAREIYDGIGRLAARGAVVDLPELERECRGHGIDAMDVVTITDDIHSAVGWQKSQAKIVDAWKRKQLTHLGAEYAHKLKTTDPSEVIGWMQDGLHAIQAQDDRDEVVSLTDAMAKHILVLEARYRRKGEYPGIPCGIRALDHRFLGFQSERLYYVCARPSQGKSALLMQMASAIALGGVPVGVISLESSKTEFLDRLLANQSRVDSNSVVSGYGDSRVLINVTNAALRIGDAPIYLYDRPNGTIADVRRIAHRMIARHGVKLVFIDYLQLIQVPAAKDRRESVATASMALKGIAREFRVPVVAAAQLNRDSDDRRPHIGDIQWSSQAEQDADGIVLIQRKMMANEEEENSPCHTYFFHIDKNRDGAKGTSRMRFTGMYLLFEEDT